jgi:hypothetical protein
VRLPDAIVAFQDDLRLPGVENQMIDISFWRRLTSSASALHWWWTATYLRGEHGMTFMANGLAGVTDFYRLRLEDHIETKEFAIVQ